MVNVSKVFDLLAEFKSCRIEKDLFWQSIVHAKALESGHSTNKYVATELLRIYAKSGSMTLASTVFHGIPKPDVVCWNALIMGYVENEEGYASLDVFSMMKARGCVPDSFTYVAALKGCIAMKGNANECLVRAKDIHAEIGHHMNTYLQNTLIYIYGKCGSMLEARNVFESIQYPDVVSWTSLLSGYAENGEELAVLDLFSEMKELGCVPNSFTYATVFKACSSLATNGDDDQKRDCLKRGRKIHSEVSSHLNHFVKITLIDMYSNCDSMIEARIVFDSIEKLDTVCWNALLSGYVKNGEGCIALDMFYRMKVSYGCIPDSVTYIAALMACTDDKGSLKRTREIHLEIGCHMNKYVENTLIDVYGKCGSMHDARLVFEGTEKPNVVSWNALILGYLKNGEGYASLDLFFRMKASGCEPDSVTYIAVLKASAVVGAVSFGRKLHSKIKELNEFDTRIVTRLVDFYAKCGSMVEAREVFDTHSSARNISTWTALLAGYARLVDCKHVFDVFEAMQDEKLQPNAGTFVCLLLCCSHAGLVERAWEYFEAMPLRYQVTPTIMHYNCMVDVLSRANQLNNAAGVIQKMNCQPDIVTWVTLLAASCKFKNLEIGRGAFQSLVDMNRRNAALGYELLARI